MEVLSTFVAKQEGACAGGASAGAMRRGASAQKASAKASRWLALAILQLLAEGLGAFLARAVRLELLLDAFITPAGRQGGAPGRGQGAALKRQLGGGACKPLISEEIDIL